jgi:hypothetical protein
MSYDAPAPPNLRSPYALAIALRTSVLPLFRDQPVWRMGALTNKPAVRSDLVRALADAGHENRDEKVRAKLMKQMLGEALEKMPGDVIVGRSINSRVVST